MKKTSLQLVWTAGLLAAAVHAEPYFTVTSGKMCSACHYNVSGGGIRTDFGAKFAQSEMALLGAGGLFEGKVNESISLGGVLQAEERHRLKVDTSLESSRQASVTQANIFARVDMIPEMLSFYWDQRFEPTTTTREMFGMVRPLPGTHLKIGKILPAYGLRLPDDEAFIRSTSGYTSEGSELGIEAGWEPGSHSVVAMITNDRFSAMTSAVWRMVFAGLSYGHNVHDLDDNTYGVFGGISLWKFALLGEADLIQTPKRDSRATYLELTAAVLKGLNLRMAYDFLQPNAKISYAHNGRDRLTAGVEVFPIPFLQLSGYYRINRWIPVNPEANQDEFWLQSQVFF